MGNSDSHACFIDGVQRLLSEDIAGDDHTFWTMLFAVPLSLEDVFEMVSPEHVRQLRHKRPGNLQALLRQLVRTMANLCAAAEDGPLQGTLITTAFTSIRLLMRVVPFLFEDCGDPVLDDILWRPGGWHPLAAAARSAEGVEASNATEANSAELSGEAANSAGSADPSADVTVCGHEILHHINKFLFLPGFTITLRSGGERGVVLTDRIDPRVVWKGGVGISDQIPAMPASSYIRARSEVLRCILACLSEPLFQGPDDYQERPSKWLQHYISSEKCHSANLFCSLMSTVFSYDPVGWGVPYSGYFAGGTEEDLVDSALQVLCVCMDFHMMDAAQATVEEKETTIEERDEADGAEGNSDGEEAVAKLHRPPGNVFRHMLQNTTRDAEIDLIFTGVVRLLSTVHQANQTYLPNSFRSVGFYQEALVLLWHLLTVNRAFTDRIADSADTNQILLPVLYLLQQAQNRPEYLGLLHTASFVLLVLSSERSFAVRLNQGYLGNIPLQLPNFKGCFTDVLALVLCKVVSDCLPRPQNDALVEMLLTVLCNVSPYVKSFAPESCLKLTALVERCSRPAYVFRSAFTHHGLAFLLEMLNNIIQYQFEGNTMLVYAVLRQKECYEHLANLKLPKAYAREQDPPRSLPQESEGSGEEGPWTPNEAWLVTVKKKLPLQAILCCVDHLGPRVQALCEKMEVTDQDQVLSYLRQTTLVGILPVPHPIVIRTYQASNYTAMWFTSYLWGVIFTRSQRMPLYDWKKIRLVVINQ